MLHFGTLFPGIFHFGIGCYFLFAVSCKCLLLEWPNFLPSATLKFHLIMKYFLNQENLSNNFFFSLFICDAVCFAKMNIPTELTPIWQCWHKADGCSSYAERCYRRLTVKICYLNRVACWHRVECWLLRVYTCEIRLCEGHWYKIEDVKLFNSKG